MVRIAVSPLLLLFSGILLACGGGSTAQPDAAPRPAGWGEDSHGKDAVPSYDTVFPDGQVLRIDLTIAATDWQAALDDMTAMYGELGGGGGGTTDSRFPAEMLAACAGVDAGDACDAPTPMGDVPGTCLAYDQLACFPDMLISACTGHAVGDDCAPPPPPGGEAPSGTCQPSDDATLACMIPFLPPGSMESVNPIWIPAEVVFGDRTWWQVGFRFKGNSTLWHTWETGGLKLPFKLDFDQFEDPHPEIADQRFWGFEQISLANNARDDSYLREKVTGDLFREAGVPSPRRAFYRVTIDFGQGPIYFGLYTAAEVPDSPLFTSQLGGKGGNLYKPTGPAATFALGFDLDAQSFAKQNHEDAADWSDVEAARTALHADPIDPTAWRATLEQSFDAEGFVGWLAVNTVIEDWDTYGNSPHNYYLYGDPGQGGRLRWIPWDHNEAFAAAHGLFPPLSLDLSEVDAGWPLIRFLLDDPVYQQLYYDRVADFTAAGFAAAALAARFQREHDRIAPYVVGADGEVAPYTVLDSAEAFAASLDRLAAHVAERHQAVAEALAGR